CGITRPTDAVDAADAGADAIGVNFVRESSRYVELDAARAILDVVPEHVMTVGVFRDHSAEEILSITSSLALDAAQLHGDDPPGFSARIAAQVECVIRAVPATSSTVHTLDAHRADIVMLDAVEPGGGVPFDWSVV